MTFNREKRQIGEIIMSHIRRDIDINRYMYVNVIYAIKLNQYKILIQANVFNKNKIILIRIQYTYQ